jgi:antitoxin HicB
MPRRIGKKSLSSDAQNGAGIAALAQVLAIKRSLTFQIQQAMNENRLTKPEMARRMETSRSQLNRLLGLDTESVTLDTVARAAQAVGRRVKLELV